MVRVPWEHRERSPTSAWEKGFLEGRHLWGGGGKGQLLQEIIYAKGGDKNVQVSSGRHEELSKVSWRSLGGEWWGEEMRLWPRTTTKGLSYGAKGSGFVLEVMGKEERIVNVRMTSSEWDER